MGRGTKHKADWKETTLQVVIDARRLYCHSVKIMGNEKVFNPKNDFQNSTLIKIQESLLSVYTRVWDANRINVSKEPDLACERLTLQKWAIVDCKRLFALFELAKPQFHIASAKFWNWMNMLVELNKKLDAWHKSDVERYGSKEDLSNQGGCRLISLCGQRVVAFG